MFWGSCVESGGLCHNRHPQFLWGWPRTPTPVSAGPPSRFGWPVTPVSAGHPHPGLPPKSHPLAPTPHAGPWRDLFFWKMLWCHISGKFCGAAHATCNKKLRINPKTINIPAMFHNLKGYNAHILMQAMSQTEGAGELKCIANNMEKYISFSLGNLQFIHSWMAPYIRMNKEFRKKAKNNFKKDFYKLMKYSVFGKTMENLCNQVDMRLARSHKWEKIRKLIANPLYSRHKFFANDLARIQMHKSLLYLNKPVYTGITILENSKILMYDFFYNVLKRQYGLRATVHRHRQHAARNQNRGHPERPWPTTSAYTTRSTTLKATCSTWTKTKRFWARWKTKPP